jgi:hypothetical protein
MRLLLIEDDHTLRRLLPEAPCADGGVFDARLVPGPIERLGVYLARVDVVVDVLLAAAADLGVEEVLARAGPVRPEPRAVAA